MKKKLPKTARIWSSHVATYENSRMWIYSKLVFYRGLRWFKGPKNRYLWCVCGYSRHLSFNGEHQKAIGICEEAKDKYRSFLEKVSAAKADVLLSLGEAFFYQGNYRESKKKIKEATAILEDPDHQARFPNFREGLANAKMLEGKCKWKEGRYYEALEHYCEALTLYLEDGSHQEKSYVFGQLYSLIGQVYIDLGQLDEAGGFIGRAKKILSRESSREALFLGAARNAEGRMLLMKYERSKPRVEEILEEANACLEDADLLFQKARFRHKNRFLASVQSNMGQMWLCRYKFERKKEGTKDLLTRNPSYLEEAKRHFEKELEQRVEIFNQSHHPTIGRIYAFLSEISFEEGDYEKAAHQAQLGIISVVKDFNHEDLCCNPDIDEEQLKEPFPFIDSPSILLQLLSRKGEALIQLYERGGGEEDFDRVFDTLKRALALSDLLRDDQNMLEAKQEQVRQARPIQELALELMEGYLNKNRELDEREERIRDDLFQIVQRSQAPLTLDMFQVNIAGASAGGQRPIPNARKMDSVLRHIFQAPLGQIDIEMVRGWWQSLQFEKEQAAKIAQNNAVFRFPPIKSVRDFQQVIDQKEKEKAALISYFVGSRNVFVGVVTRESLFSIRKLSFQQSPDTIDSFKRDLEHLVSSMESWRDKKKRSTPRDWFDFPLLSHRLYKKLIEEVGVLSPEIERVYFIPDQELSFLPFEILLTSNASPSDSVHDLPFLFKRVNISYYASLSMLFNKYGDNGRERMTSVLPTANGNRENEAFCGFITRLFDKDGNLMAEDKQVKQCAATLGLVAEKFKDQKFEVNTSMTAMEKQRSLTDWIGEARFLYFSVLLQNGPDGQPQIVLKRSLKPDDTENNFILSIEDVQRIKMSFDLMIFYPRVQDARATQENPALAFFQQTFLNSLGKNILFALRPIPPDAWQTLITTYMDLLFTERRSFSKTLQRTKLRMLRHSRFSHPRNWAGLVYWGNQMETLSG